MCSPTVGRDLPLAPPTRRHAFWRHRHAQPRRRSGVFLKPHYVHLLHLRQLAAAFAPLLKKERTEFLCGHPLGILDKCGKLLLIKVQTSCPMLRAARLPRKSRTSRLVRSRLVDAELNPGGAELAYHCCDTQVHRRGPATSHGLPHELLAR